MAVERCPINDGDFAVVRQTATAKNGDIPTRHFLRLPIGGKVTSLAPAAATSAYDPFLSCLLGRLLDIEKPIFTTYLGVRHFFWQPCYAFPRGMGVEARRLPAARNKAAVRGVSGV